MPITGEGIDSSYLVHPNEVDRHVEKRNASTFICTVCGHISQTKVTPVLAEIAPTSGPLPFLFCDGQRAQNQDFYHTMLFIYRYNCQVHVMGSHGPDMQIKCPECSVVCRNPHSLKCHMNNVHKDRKRLYMIRS